MILIPANASLLTLDREQSPDFGYILDATIPATWPPPLLDKDAFDDIIRSAEAGSDPFFSYWYWVLRPGTNGIGTLIGSGGTLSLPESPGVAMIGYSVLGEFENRGYATEAVRGMIRAVFSQPDLRQIRAATYPSLPASIRVLEKTGFVCAGAAETGQGIGEGTILYLLERPGY